MLGDIEKAKIVITNYHAFKRETTVSQDRWNLAEGTRGRDTHSPDRWADDQARHGRIDGHENIMVINDEVTAIAKSRRLTKMS